MRIVNIYRPPPSATNGLTVALFLNEFSLFLEQLVITYAPLVIVGDFNFHVNDPGDTTARRFLDLLDSFGLCQNVCRATHISGHTLDLVISNSNVEHEILNGISITNPVLSDHHAVCFNLSLTRPKFERRLIASRKIKSIDFDLFTKELQESSLLQNRPSDDLPELVGLYNSVLRSLLDNHAPL